MAINSSQINLPISIDRINRALVVVDQQRSDLRSPSTIHATRTQQRRHHLSREQRPWRRQTTASRGIL